MINMINDFLFVTTAVWLFGFNHPRWYLLSITLWNSDLSYVCFHSIFAVLTPHLTCFSTATFTQQLVIMSRVYIFHILHFTYFAKKFYYKSRRHFAANYNYLHIYHVSSFILPHLFLTFPLHTHSTHIKTFYTSYFKNFEQSFSFCYFLLWSQISFSSLYIH